MAAVATPAGGFEADGWLTSARTGKRQVEGIYNSPGGKQYGSVNKALVRADEGPKIPLRNELRAAAHEDTPRRAERAPASSTWEPPRRASRGTPQRASRGGAT